LCLKITLESNDNNQQICIDLFNCSRYSIYIFHNNAFEQILNFLKALKAFQSVLPSIIILRYILLLDFLGSVPLRSAQSRCPADICSVPLFLPLCKFSNKNNPLDCLRKEYNKSYLKNGFGKKVRTNLLASNLTFSRGYGFYENEI